MRLRTMLRCCFTSWRLHRCFQSMLSVWSVSLFWTHGTKVQSRMTEVQQNWEGGGGRWRESLEEFILLFLFQAAEKKRPSWLRRDRRLILVFWWTTRRCRLCFLTEDVDFLRRRPSEYFKYTSLSQGAVCNLKKQRLQSAVKWKDGAAATQGS